MKHFLLTLLFIIGVVSAGDVNAQLFHRNHAKPSEKPPKYILVQLFTYQRRIDYNNIRGKKDRAEQANKDAEKMMQKMIMDFTDNFDFCPVYYFIDTNQSLVLQKKFNGILLDKDLKPVSGVNPDGYYQIVYFGVGSPTVSDIVTERKNDSYDADYNIGEKQRLVVLNPDYSKVKKPVPNGANNKNGGPLKQPVENYKYRSPVFEIYYLPLANHLSRKMYLFYYG